MNLHHKKAVISPIPAFLIFEYTLNGSNLPQIVVNLYQAVGKINCPSMSFAWKSSNRAGWLNWPRG